MTQRVWSYLDEYASEREDLLAAVDQVFSSGRLVLGASVAGFEREFADAHGRTHGVGVDNGTNAIVLALKALGIGAGDEVVTVANTAAPTIVAIDAVGATPLFVDVGEDDHLMDTSQLAAVIGPRTRCLLPVHLFGQCVAMEPLLALAREHDLVVLEDCAQAHGARHHGAPAGAAGHAAAFSFYPTKVLGAYGDGGAVVLDDDDVAHRLRRLRYYGMDAGDYHVIERGGLNSRLDEVQAEILRRKLRRLPRYVAARQALARRYDDALAGTDLVLPTVADGNEHSYYLYVVRHPERDRILALLRERGIHLTVSYPTPVHLMTGYRTLGGSPGDLPVTERLAQQIFSLPMYPSLTTERQDRAIDAVLDVLDRL